MTLNCLHSITLNNLLAISYGMNMRVKGMICTTPKSERMENLFLLYKRAAGCIERTIGTLEKGRKDKGKQEMKLLY